MLGYQVDEVAAALRVPPRTVERYVSKVLHFREVKANTIGKPINSGAMHPHVVFLLWKQCLISTPKIKDTTELKQR